MIKKRFLDTFYDGFLAKSPAIAQMFAKTDFKNPKTHASPATRNFSSRQKCTRCGLIAVGASQPTDRRVITMLDA